MFDKEKVVNYIDSLSYLVQESVETGNMSAEVQADALELMRGLTAILRGEVKVA